LVVAVSLLGATQAQAQNRQSHSGDLFYNYYTPPGYGGVAAQMYVSPLPVPPLAGHTYITYQPLMPHEFLYQHNRTYVHNHEGGQTVTRVRWNHNPMLQRGVLLPAQRAGKNAAYPQHF
jgi:hypothetical protein